jgi:hypothetical protein
MIVGVFRKAKSRSRVVIRERQDGVVAANSSGATGSFDRHVKNFVSTMFAGLV